jgi:membrane protein DedA with SNARE-associated domain
MRPAANARRGHAACRASRMTDAIIEFISSHGYWAIALLMFAENVFPPLPSEMIMPFAGFVAARGELSVAGVVAAGVMGSLAGGLPWFFLARRWGAEKLKCLADRHGRWLTVSRSELDRAERWFQRHGVGVLVLGRLVPGVRTLVAVPAGLAGMSLRSFLVWSSLGSLLWTGLLTAAGYLLEDRYEEVVGVLDPAAKLVLASIVVAYAVRVVRGCRRA